ncbi:MAG: glycosyltransferase, partial [Comamonas sp.]
MNAIPNIPARERHVICMKWGTKYGPEYVNRLYAMVRRNLQGDFRFICLTDDSQGIRAEVECLPIPSLDLPKGLPERGWAKLATFTPDLHGLRGTALFLDVDVVVTGPLDDFFTQPGEFLII